MALTVTTQITKPESAIFWRYSDTDAYTRYVNIISNYPGVISFTESEPTNTSITSVTVCQDANVWTSLLSALAENDDCKARKTYNTTNGIEDTSTLTTS